MVDLTFVSWNRIDEWLRGLDVFGSRSEALRGRSPLVRRDRYFRTNPGQSETTAMRAVRSLPTGVMKRG